MAEFGVRRFDAFPYPSPPTPLLSASADLLCPVPDLYRQPRDLAHSLDLAAASQAGRSGVDKPVNPSYHIEVNFGKILRQLRSEQSIGIKKLAPALGVDYSYLSKLENESIGPSAEMVARVATYFNYDYNRLLLSAGKVPDEVLAILRENPDEALEFLRERFGSRHDT
jgi:transcriptional regulator with XRE-family HTH domain